MRGQALSETDTHRPLRYGGCPRFRRFKSTDLAFLWRDFDLFASSACVVAYAIFFEIAHPDSTTMGTSDHSRTRRITSLPSPSGNPTTTYRPSVFAVRAEVNIVR